MGPCRLPALLAVTAVVALAGCGGANDPAGEPPTTAPPSPVETKPQSPEAKQFPAAFTRKVDPICVKAQSQIDKVAGTRARSQPALEKLAAIYGGTAKRLEGLKPPAKNAPAYQEFTGSFRDAQDLFKRLDQEVGRGDTSAYQRVPSTLDQVNTDIKDQASQYGFQGCARD
jgi:hypothetical protein